MDYFSVCVQITLFINSRLFLVSNNYFLKQICWFTQDQRKLLIPFKSCKFEKLFGHLYRFPVGFSNTEPLKHPDESDSGNKEVVEHLPKLMPLHVTKFLKRPTNSGKVTVTGNRVNRGPGRRHRASLRIPLLW